MRLDKYLKVSRIIKRRTIANEACSAGRCLVNGKLAKSAHEVKIGDIIEVRFASGVLKIEILSIAEHVKKDDAASMYKQL